MCRLRIMRDREPVGRPLHTPSLPRCAWASRGQGNAWPVTAEGWLPTTWGDHHPGGTSCQLCGLASGRSVFYQCSVTAGLWDGYSAPPGWISSRDREALSHRVLNEDLISRPLETAGHNQLQD